MSAERAVISRRVFAGGLAGVIGGLPGICLAQVQDFRERGAWRKIPQIVVMSAENDPRLTALHEAVAFWNAALSSLGSSFRLVSPAIVPKTITDTDLRPSRDFSEARQLYDWKTGSFNLRELVTQRSDDVVIVFPKISMGSFALQYFPVRKFLVVIGTPILRPVTESNRIQNVIAHELGHVIGLGHNNDETSLMCGGSAQCNTTKEERGFLPLTRGDKKRLIEMYPPGWQAL
jgi:matrixin